MDLLAQNLPQVLVNEIFSYNPLHREYMKELMNEMLLSHHKWNMAPVFDELMVQECDNEYWQELMMTDAEESQCAVIFGERYHFCCENCAGQGEWNIRSHRSGPAHRIFF